MANVRNLSDIQQETAFTEFDFYQRQAVEYAWNNHKGISSAEESLQEWRLSQEHTEPHRKSQQTSYQTDCQRQRNKNCRV